MALDYKSWHHHMPSDSPQLSLELNQICTKNLSINEMLMPWKWRYMDLRVRMCVCWTCISTSTHAPQRRREIWESPEKEEKASLIKDDAWRVQVTSALLSVPSTTHSTLISSPNFCENWKSLQEIDVSLQIHIFLTHLPYIHFLRPLPVLFWGWGLLCNLKYFFKLT